MPPGHYRPGEGGSCGKGHIEQTHSTTTESSEEKTTYSTPLWRPTNPRRTQARETSVSSSPRPGPSNRVDKEIEFVENTKVRGIKVRLPRKSSWNQTSLRKYGTLRASKAKKAAAQQLDYLCGMRDPFTVVLQMSLQSIGIRIRAAWEAFERGMPNATVVAETYGTKDCTLDLDPNLVDGCASSKSGSSQGQVDVHIAFAARNLQSLGEEGERSRSPRS